MIEFKNMLLDTTNISLVKEYNNFFDTTTSELESEYLLHVYLINSIISTISYSSKEKRDQDYLNLSNSILEDKNNVLQNKLEKITQL